MEFPNDFMWGAASAAYQIEGAYNEDGKGLGIWDALSYGHVKHGENGNVACDHYHRYKEDVALMKELGLKTYRFSVSWPRVMPEEGVVNETGLQFYINLVGELVQAGIQPMCTLFHWNLPLWLHEKGGWKFDGIEEFFEEYTKIVVGALSDKVSYWMTFNEPACFIGLGYAIGAHAPFESRMDKPQEMMNVLGKCTRNMLRSHGKAVDIIRRYAKTAPRIGMALNGDMIIPLTESDEEIIRAKEATFDTKFVFNVPWFADTAILGTVPEVLKNAISSEDIDVIHKPLDFFGFNCYNANNFDEDFANPNKSIKNLYPGMPRTMMEWPITPCVLYWLSRFFHGRYHLPILITENGMANLDFVMSDGRVHDPQRIEFMKAYLKGLERAIDEGIPVLGYTYWSFMDNFEWAHGYDKRFGLVYVDYQTQKRVLKDSAYWYADVIRKNSLDT